MIINRFLIRSSSIIGRSYRMTLSSRLLHQQHCHRSISLLSFPSLSSHQLVLHRCASKSAKTNKKYQVCLISESFSIEIFFFFQPISYGPKSKRPIIEIYHKMTIRALAKAMDINVGKRIFFLSFLFSFLFVLDHIYDCLIHIKNGDQYSSDDQGSLFFLKIFVFLRRHRNRSILQKFMISMLLWKW